MVAMSDSAVRLPLIRPPLPERPTPLPRAQTDLARIEAVVRFLQNSRIGPIRPLNSAAPMS